jgi:hypothetical protein
MSDENWKDLPDLQAVSEAQRNGWEIETDLVSGSWVKWGGTTWLGYVNYRGRPAKLKFLCYTNGINLMRQVEGIDPKPESFTKRFPTGDLEGDVEP